MAHGFIDGFIVYFRAVCLVCYKIRGLKMKTYKVELIVKIQEESYPDKWLADAVYELLEPENGEQIVKYRVTELNPKEATPCA